MSLMSTQMDLGVAAWGTLKAMRNLMKSASIDDVQPHTVTMMASLGARMNVDPRLIIPASEALGGDQSVKIEQLKLSLGLVSGGIASEIRKSSTAVRAFLLITALSTTMLPRDISEVLMEMLLQSRQLEETVVNPAQLLKLIQSFEGNSHALLKDGHLPNDVLDVIRAVTNKERSNSQRYFEPLDASPLADVLLEVFDAIRDEGIGRLRITGNYGALTVVTVLVWLFPDAVEVRTYDEAILFHCRKSPGKVTVVLNNKLAHGPWKKEVWYNTDPSTLFGEQANNSAAIPSSEPRPFTKYEAPTARAPCSLLYSLWQATTQDHDLSTVANISLALVTAVLRTSKLERDNPGHLAVPQSLDFREICSPEFLSTYMNFPIMLGFPRAFIDPDVIHRLGQRFTEREISFEDGAGKETNAWLDELHEDIFGGKTCRKLLFGGSWWSALSVADLALASATRTDLTDSVVTLPMFSVPGRAEDSIALRLLGKGRKMKASTFIQYALLAAHGPDIRPPVSSLIAASGFGRVCYLSALIQPPTQIRDAFRISVQPGQIRWRNSHVRSLYDEQLTFVPFPATNPAAFIVDSDTESHPASLRVRDYRPFQYFLTSGIEDDSAHLICEREFYTDSRSLFTKSLINWAMAMRPIPSKRSPDLLLTLLEKEGVTRLQLKHPAVAALHCFLGQFGSWMRAVAVFNQREKLHFLEYGTHDTCDLHCIIQGQTSLRDCIAQALEVYGDGWVVMSNPSHHLS